MNGVKRNRAKLSDTASLAIASIETVEELPVFTPAPVRRWDLAILALALVSGAALMSPALGGVPLAMDEYGTYWIISDLNPLSLMERSLKYENIPPLSPILRRAFLAILGENEVTFRLPSFTWYLLTVCAVYLLGRDMLGSFRGSLAALICAWHQNVLGEVQIARCYGLGLLLATLAYWVTVRWLKTPKSIPWAIAWVLLSAGLVWTHYLNLAVTISQLAVLAYGFRRESMHVKSLLIVSIAGWIGSTIPLMPALFRMAEWGASFGYQGADPIWRILIPMWWMGLPVGAAVAFLLSRRSPSVPQSVIPKGSFVLLLLWGLLPPLLASIVCRDDFASLSNPRYRIGYAGPAACLVAACLSHRRAPSVAFVATIVCILFAWLPAPRKPWSMKRLGQPEAYEWRDLARQIEQRGEPGEPIFVQSGLGESFLIPAFYLDPVFLDYAGCRLGRFYCKTEHPRIGLPFLWESFKDMKAHYEGLVAGYAAGPLKTLWVAGATDTDLNLRSVEGFDAILTRQGFRPIEQTRFRNTVLLRYRYQPAE
jgi:hypothetical protein